MRACIHIICTYIRMYIHVLTCAGMAYLYPVVAAAMAKWQELKLSGGLEGAEQEEELDIYSEARMTEVNILCMAYPHM